MAFLLTHVLILLGILAVALATGLPLARWLGCGSILERLAWGSCLGLLVAAQALHALALCGLLSRPTLWVAIVVAVGVGLRDLAMLARDAQRFLRERPRRAAMASAGAAIFLAPFLLWALYPPHAWDETIYHLVFARSFAVSGSLPFLEQLRAPVFPPLAELLDAAVLLVADDVSTHWISLLAAFATAGLVAVWDAPREAPTPGDGSPPRLAAAALYLGAPMVVYLSGVSYVDILLALWVTAAIAAWHRALAAESRRWLAVSAICAGSAAGVKYLGLFFVGWLAFEILLRWPGAPARRAGACAAWLAVAAVGCVPVYARIFAFSGNPLFPFYPGFFGSSPWEYESAAPPASLASRLGDGLALPWRAVFDRAAVGGLPPLSWFWLASLLVACIGAWRFPRWRSVLAMAAVYLLLIPAHARYFLPAVAVLGLSGIDTAYRLLPSGRSRAAVGVTAALLLAAPGWMYAISLCARRGPLPLDAAARDAFLTRNLECYPAVAFLNRTRGARYTAYGMELERLSALANGRWLGDLTGPAGFERVRRLLGAPELLAGDLRTMGADVLVLPHRLAPSFAAAGVGGWRASYDDGSCEVFEVPPSR